MEKIYKLNKSGVEGLHDWVVDLDSIKPDGATDEQIKECLGAILFMAIEWHSRGWLAICKLFPKVYFEKTKIGQKAQEIYDYGESHPGYPGTMWMELASLQYSIVRHAPKKWKSFIEEVVYAT